MSQRDCQFIKAEYDILRILWKKKEKQTVREVHDELYPTYHWAYTTKKR